MARADNMMNVNPSKKPVFSITRALLLWRFLEKDKKFKIYVYGFLTMVSAFTDVISIGLIAPFIVVFLQPETVLENNLGGMIADYFDLQTIPEFQLFLCLSFSGATIVAGITKLLLTWFQSRLSYGISADLANQIFSNALHKSYEYHLGVSSNEIISSIASKASIVADNLIQPMLSFLLAIVTIFFVGSLLMSLNHVVTIIIFGSIGSCYILIIVMIKGRVAAASKIVNSNFVVVMRVLREGIEGIRYVMLTTSQRVFIKSHAVSEHALRNAQADINFASLFPRAVIESFALLIFAWVIYVSAGYSGASSDESFNSFAFVGVMAMAVQRLLPIIQQAYSGWARLSGASRIIDDTLHRLEGYQKDRALVRTKPSRLTFDENIILKNVSFKYQASGKSLVLNNINLEINRFSKIGITGPSGSGKSTLIDLIMGFLEPVSGKIFIDGCTLNGSGKRDNWHANISLVPQNIYLADSSIISNIAFGLTADEINVEKVEEVIKITQLKKLVASLDGGYDYIVGEGGKNLSHGQRQRIGIARALYRETDLLVIDEGTSALDRQTQASIIKNLNALVNSPAIIMVAHRIEILDKYDAIYEVKDGSLVRLEN